MQGVFLGTQPASLNVCLFIYADLYYLIFLVFTVIHFLCEYKQIISRNRAGQEEGWGRSMSMSRAGAGQEQVEDGGRRWVRSRVGARARQQLVPRGSGIRVAVAISNSFHVIFGRISAPILCISSELDKKHS